MLLTQSVFVLLSGLLLVRCPYSVVKEQRPVIAFNGTFTIQNSRHFKTKILSRIVNRKLFKFGGADPDRTGDPLLAKQVLSQLSYSPFNLKSQMILEILNLVGLGRIELPTSRLSGVRSNHLSYRPLFRLSPIITRHPDF